MANRKMFFANCVRVKKKGYFNWTRERIKDVDPTQYGWGLGKRLGSNHTVVEPVRGRKKRGGGTVKAC